MLNGQGTASVPYRIEAAADLAEICRDLSACYSLASQRKSSSVCRSTSARRAFNSPLVSRLA